MTVRSGRADVLRSERVAGGMLPRVLGTSDMVAIFVAIVLLVTSSLAIGVALYLIGRRAGARTAGLDCHR